MPSIIQELQIEAASQSGSVSDLLRRAKIVAVKLELKEFEEWIEKELNGYNVTSPKDLPPYRVVTGEVKAWNPYHGWQPILFGDAKAGEIMSERGVSQPIGELDDLIKSPSDHSTFMIDYNASAKKFITDAIGYQTDIKFMVGRSAITGILEGVRNLILDWTLKLEKAGVKGEGISFSKEDKEKAQAGVISYHIGNIENFAGAMGSVSGNATVSIQQNNLSKKEIKDLVTQIDKYLPQINLKPQQVVEAKALTKDLDEEVKKVQPEPSKIRAALSSLRNIFEGVTGNVIAQGIIAEITKHLSH
jgi:hypothetical protein